MKWDIENITQHSELHTAHLVLLGYQIKDVTMCQIFKYEKKSTTWKTKKRCDGNIKTSQKNNRL